MYELHQHEQYFWDEPTLRHLADFASDYLNPCCVGAPMLGRALEQQGVAVRTLDVDERFADLAGFRRWDLYRSEWLGEEFGLIICDPPFFNVSLSQLFVALRVLARHDFGQPLLVAYLARRSEAMLGTLAPFSLAPTGYHPGYVTVQRSGRNDIELFGNLGEEVHARLRRDREAERAATPNPARTR